MYHSITFGEKNTWTDWHLVPVSRPVFNPPSVKTKTLDIPGGNGLIDLTESLTGYPLYNNREGSIEFYVLNDFHHLVNTSEEWQEVYSSIMDYLHGQEMTAILDDDPDYYYKGRFTVSNWSSEESYSKITIDYSVEPYKWTNNLVRYSITVPAGSTICISFPSGWCGRAPVCPTWTITSDEESSMTIHFINTTLGIDYSTSISTDDGAVQFSDIVFFGDSEVYPTNSSDVAISLSVEFHKGRL